LEDKIMPVIRKSADLRNNYGEISQFCHKFREPVFITKNGAGDLAVMSIETYEEIAGRNELYRLIQEGIDDVENGRTLNEKEILKNMEIVLGK
jgi:PHD/YefM family antitoxin component YafN of YafNO toxin-antitoxin module